MIANVVLGQVPIGWNVTENVATVEEVLRQARPFDLVVLPEGMISGYDDQLTGLSALDPEVVTGAADEIGELVRKGRVHLFCGSLVFGDGAWSNAVIHFSPEGTRRVYRKVNLATHERPYLDAGSDLPVFELSIGEESLFVSPQLCRELRYPDQWHVPARQGAELFVYLSHAVNEHESMSVWRSHLVSRAAETQRFVAAVNVAHPHQHCPTMVVAPSGEVVAEATNGEAAIIRISIDLSDVSNWYLDQQRSDVVGIRYPA